MMETTQIRLIRFGECAGEEPHGSCPEVMSGGIVHPDHRYMCDCPCHDE